MRDTVLMTEIRRPVVAVLTALAFLYFAARREERGLAALSQRRPS